MKSTKEILKILSHYKPTAQKKYGMTRIGIFGSVARGEQTEGSDVDICVDMETSLYLLVRLKRFLEQLLQCTVDLVRMHKQINPYLLENIERDGIYVIR